VLLGNPSRLRDELGWTPAIPLDRTLDDLLAYWRSNATENLEIGNF
jgi:nucleoside-diphosphate-sugar epimerase